MVQHMDKPALTKQWVLEAQWTDLPEEVEQIVKDLWRLNDLGNDKYIYITSIESLLETKEDPPEVERWFVEERRWGKVVFNPTPLINYLREKSVPEKETIWIHWWW